MPQLTVQQALDLALRHQRAGQGREAELIYRQILAFQPGNADALHLLGVAAAQDGRHSDAADLIRQALYLRPNWPAALNNLGVALKDCGELDEAIAVLRQAIALESGLPESHNNLGNALKDQGQLDEAIAEYRQSIAIRPAYAEANSNLGNALRHKGQVNQAIAACRHAIELDPNLPDAHNNLGNALMDRGMVDAGIAAYRRAIALNPKSAEFHSNLGNVLRDKGQLEEAIAAHRQAVAIAPGSFEAHNNLANSLKDLGHLDEAIAIYRTAIALKPDYFDLHNNLGGALKDKGQIDEAMASYRRAIALNPDYADAHNNLGVVLQKEKLNQAIDAFRQAVALKPAYAEAHFNLSLALLTDGDFQQGWQEYEWRLKLKDVVCPWRDLAGPRWDGRDLNGQTILVYTEQGFGDAFQAARYVPMVAARGGRVIIMCQAAQAGLMRNLHGVIDVVVESQTRPRHDVVVPMMSLPMLFGTTAQSIPAEVPYLQADSNRVESWRRRLSRYPGFKVGLVWRGSPKPDPLRSCPLLELAPLGAVSDAHFVSLQVGEGSLQAGKPGALNLVDVSADLVNFAETAACMVNLDLIITVDTAAAHLAGALGRRTWTMLPVYADWRWMRNREDSPWYPTMRLFRQTRREQWGEVVARMVQELRSIPRKAITIKPHVPEAHYNLGIGLIRRGQVDGAIDAFRQAIALKPGFPQACNSLGSALIDRGRYVEAIANCRTAISLDPALSEGHNNLGVALQRSGQLDEAIAAYRQAIALDANFPEALRNLASVLRATGQLNEAIAVFSRVAALRPNDPEAPYNLGNALKDNGQVDEAIAAYRQALVLKSDYADAHNNLGLALQRGGRLEEAIVAYRQALALRPDSGGTYGNLGNALREKGQLDESIAACRQAVALMPESPDAHHNLALGLLARGELSEGFSEFEWRWKCRDFPSPWRKFAQPLWDGRPLAGATLLLHAEQGFGDTIQFIRYLPTLAASAGKIIVECQPALQRLLRSTFSECSVVSDGCLPAFDVHCPVLSLPRVFGTTPRSIPAHVPYLIADPELVEFWRRKLANSPAGRRVALAWAGNPKFKDDRTRSLSLDRLAPLAKVCGAAFYSVQKGDAARQVDHPPTGLQLVNLAPELQDFADTAAVLSLMDLVITTDTSVAHLAGALGRPVWVMLQFSPDWRWLRDRADSPWYPSMQLFRQASRGEWDDVIKRVVGALSLGRRIEPDSPV